MENYDKLKAVIHEANEDIMKLQFGCEVEFQGIPGIYTGDNHAGNAFVYMEFGSQTRIFGKKNLKILGRPIRLSDVLVAIQHGNNYNILIDAVGSFWEFTCGGNPDYIIKPCKVGWNLLDDNLDNQSDECKQFLINLLVGLPSAV